MTRKRLGSARDGLDGYGWVKVWEWIGSLFVCVLGLLVGWTDGVYFECLSLQLFRTAHLSFPVFKISCIQSFCTFTLICLYDPRLHNHHQPITQPSITKPPATDHTSLDQTWLSNSRILLFCRVKINAITFPKPKPRRKKLKATEKANFDIFIFISKFAFSVAIYIYSEFFFTTVINWDN